MTVFTICYNEEFILPYFIRHYRDRFPNCRIVIYDNVSSDKSREIAEAAGCEVIIYSTNGKLDDKTYLEIKNNCWKQEKGWVIICDCDEFCDINQSDISEEEKEGTTLIQFSGYNMVNLEDNMDFDSIKYGIRATSYDKIYCFYAPKIREINYNPGCHTAFPEGCMSLTYKNYACYHYKYINPYYMIRRHAQFAKRLSEENIRRGYGGHYLYPAEQICAEFENARKNSIKLLI